jgi:hypothetical protein
MASNKIKNQLLGALPPNVFDALGPDLVHVELEVRTLIYAREDEVEWVYFPSSGMISMLQPTTRIIVTSDPSDQLSGEGPFSDLGAIPDNVRFSPTNRPHRALPSGPRSAIN